MTPVGFVHHPSALEHATGPGHPERPERAASVLARIESSGLAADLDSHAATEAPLAALERVHTSEHVARVRARCAEGFGILDGGDTTISKGSWRASLCAAGGALDAVDRVARGDWTRAFCVARPPGHHAERGHAMGFCLFNNVAVAAAHLRAEHGYERVAIIDFDVHHGNGTQHLFEDDASVFYASLHQWPHYPGTGAATERGVGAGEGSTLNCPLSAGTGDAEWIATLEERVLPALEAFRPEFLLISAGFDAHRADPLSGTCVSEDGYATITRRLTQLADERCTGRLVSLLEGGYDLDALARSVETHVGGLL